MAGPILIIVGLVFIVIGIGNFFASIGSFEPPRYFWCAFVGIPLFGLGLMITKIAFMGRLFRYVAGETAPVAKDTFNYMTEGTKQGVRSMASAVSEGLRSVTKRKCGTCGQENDSDAKFCRNCGSTLNTTCKSCGHVNASEASFCDTCGKPLRTDTSI
jgi:ribosomal protein L40E